MPRAVVVTPDAIPGVGASLPFLSRGSLTELGGEVVLADVPVSVWPTPGRNTPTGRAYDHEGEASMENRGLWGYNQRLVVDGVTYAIVDAVPQPFLPHMSLALREMRPGG